MFVCKSGCVFLNLKFKISYMFHLLYSNHTKILIFPAVFFSREYTFKSSSSVTSWMYFAETDIESGTYL